MYIAKDPVQFELPMPKLTVQPKLTLKEKMKSEFKGSFGFLKTPKQNTLVDTYAKEVRVGREYIEDGAYQGESYWFLMYAIRKASYVLVASLFCTIITYCYLKYGLTRQYMNRKEYVKSQVKVIHTINLIMFYVLFFGLMII